MLHNFPKYLKKCILLFTVLSIFSFFTGCEKKRSDSEAITAVIETMFNCPNDELVELMVGENFASPPTKEDEAAKQAYLDKISEQYSPYFTEKGYQNFDKPSYASRYHLLCDTQNYQMQVENIEMIPDNSTPPTYVTNVDLGFGAIEGLQHKIAVSFRIRCDEQGKIGYISLDDDSNQILFEELTK